MLRSTLLAAARSARAKSLVEAVPVTRSVVNRFVAGTDTATAVRVATSLVESGCKVTLDFLGEHITDARAATDTVSAYRDLLAALDDVGLARRADVSLKLSAVGQQLPTDGEKVALHNARVVCTEAARVGATVTLDMEDHTTTDSTLAILRELRVDFPWVGAVLQAYLRRTETDCRDLSGDGSRVRLCKGAYDEPESVAYRFRSEVDRSYVRCLRILMQGDGYPMVASHDPRITAITAAVATEVGRAADTFEYQMLYGINSNEQRRIAASGNLLRVYLPYGRAWYSYFMRRLAERPANLTFFLRALASQ